MESEPPQNEVRSSQLQSLNSSLYSVCDVTVWSVWIPCGACPSEARCGLRGVAEPSSVETSESLLSLLLLLLPCYYYSLLKSVCEGTTLDSEQRDTLPPSVPGASPALRFVRGWRVPFPKARSVSLSVSETLTSFRSTFSFSFSADSKQALSRKRFIFCVSCFLFSPQPSRQKSRSFGAETPSRRR